MYPCNSFLRSCCLFLPSPGDKWLQGTCGRRLAACVTTGPGSTGCCFLTAETKLVARECISSLLGGHSRRGGRSGGPRAWVWPLRLQCSPVAASSALTAPGMGQIQLTHTAFYGFLTFLQDTKQTCLFCRPGPQPRRTFGPSSKENKGQRNFPPSEGPRAHADSSTRAFQGCSYPTLFPREVKRRVAPSCWDRSDHCVWSSLLPKLLDEGNLISVPNAIIPELLPVLRELLPS